jgi:hypothetical protein
MAGRPTDYRPEYVEQARKLCALGATDDEMADFFGCDRTTFYRWRTAHPDFAEAMKVAKEAADLRVERSLYQRAVGYSHPDTHMAVVEGEVVATPTVKHYPPDATSMIFWLKNRKPDAWRDKTQTEVTGKDGGPIQQETTASESARLLLDELARLKAGAAAPPAVDPDRKT